MNVDPEASTRVAPTPLQRLDEHATKTIGNYDVVRFIAEGGMGWVFEVRSKSDPDRRLALKALKPAAGSAEELRRFLAEAKLMSGIQHPNLVGVIETGVDEATGTSFYTMPFIDSPPLSEAGKLPVDEALRIVDGVLTALAELHRRGIIHRDVKPANILLQEDGAPVLTDLGIARNSNQETMTSTGMFLGTALYCSPEQARGGKIEPQSDIFSVGLLLYRFLTGLSAYTEISEVDTQNHTSILFYLAKLDHTGADLPLEFGKEIPSAVRDLVSKACRYKSEERFTDAIAMRTALRAARGGPRKSKSAKPNMSSMIAAGTIAALAAGVAYGVSQFDPSAFVERLRRSASELMERNRADGNDSIASDREAMLAQTNRLAANGSPGGTGLHVSARQPVEPNLTLTPGRSTQLRVLVEGDKDALFYEWRVNGLPVPSNGPTFVYRSRKSATIEVLVTDQHGNQAVESWALEGPNSRPLLGLVPARRQVELAAGERRTFAARVSDPDDDPVEVVYSIDGRVVARGTSFVFESEKPGDFRLVARATDGRGGTAEVERQVLVTGAARKSEERTAPSAPAAIDPRLRDLLDLDLESLGGSELGARNGEFPRPPANNPRAPARRRRGGR